MDLAAYQRGEPEALAEFVDRCGGWVWALARRGFVCEDTLTLGAERTSIRVLGAPNPSVAFDLTVRVLSLACQPRERREAESMLKIEQRVLDIARTELFRAAERAARLISLAEHEDQSAVPAEVEDLDELLAVNERPTLKVLPLTSPESLRLEAGEHAATEALAELDARSKALVQLRFIVGLERLAIAQRFDCGSAAIAAHEDRIRRKIRHHIRMTLKESKVGDADLDAFLSKTPHRLLPPQVTWDRLRREVLTRTLREDPRPYWRRALWGLTAATVAAFAWLAMLVGWLPNPNDDYVPEPRIELRCEPACLPGAKAVVAVQAPPKTHRFAVVIRPSRNEELRPWLVAPNQGSLRLPYGARQRLRPTHIPLRIPMDATQDGEVIVVFSEHPLTATEVLEYASGQADDLEVTTATTAVL